MRPARAAVHVFLYQFDETPSLGIGVWIGEKDGLAAGIQSAQKLAKMLFRTIMLKSFRVKRDKERRRREGNPEALRKFGS